MLTDWDRVGQHLDKNHLSCPQHYAYYSQALTPISGIRESILGTFIANFVFLGTTAIILYASILISFGRYPSIPVLSEGARLQVQRGYLD